VGLLFVIYIAGLDLEKLTFASFPNVHRGTRFSDVFAVFQGAFLAFYAFVGFGKIWQCCRRKPKTRKRVCLLHYGQFSSLLLLLYIAVAVVAA